MKNLHTTISVGVACVFSLMVISCNPERQLQKAEVRLAQAGRLPAICADRFQKDTIIQKDTLLKIDTFLSGEYIFDTLRVNDTIILTKVKTLQVTKYVTKYETKVITDKAKEEALKASVSQLEAQKSNLSAQVSEYKDKAKTRLNWLILLICFILGYSIRKPLMAIIKWNLRIS